jgi:DNA-directed RNA polymerase delta subunit
MEMENQSNESADKASILDQIINDYKASEAAKLDAVELVTHLFAELNERERDVLSRRFGLRGPVKETLENIGAAHKLTRERIRQIENAGIKKLRALKDLDQKIDNLRKVINELLEEHGGLLERDYLLNNLVSFSAGDIKKDEHVALHKNHLEFLISKLLHDYFEEVSDHKQFKPGFKLKYRSLDHLEELATELVAKVKETKEILLTEDLINLSKGLETFTKHKDKFDIDQVLDISAVLGGELFKENADLINAHKYIYSLLQSVREIEQNKFGHWGIADWREISPKTINDKIFLILKNHGKPMHFVDITKKINEISFDGKEANSATVHNELILDKKYVLVGRGLYGLKDWGYSNGTVTDIIREILTSQAEEKSLSREEIVDKVLKQRMVKKATVVLALMDKKKFEKANGRYKVKDGYQEEEKKS